MKKENKILENIRIEKVGYQGIGISTREDGKKILIKGGVLPGSIVDCKVIRQKKDYIEAQVREVKKMDLEKMNDDVCQHYFWEEGEISPERKTKKGCGGCKWQILPYEYQLRLKKDIVIDSFRNIRDIISQIGINDVIASPIIDNYRNKIEFSFGRYISKRLDTQFHNYRAAGFHKQGEFSKVVDVDNCKLISAQANEIYTYLKKMFIDSGLDVYDSMVHTGFFRHLVIRQGFNTGNFLVNLGVADKNLVSDELKSKRENLKNTLVNDKYLNDTITSLVIIYNNGVADICRPADVITENLWGDGSIYEKLVYDDFGGDSLSFKISSFSFFQTNTLGAQRLFETAGKMIGHIGGEALDLYCGSGSIGLSFLKLGIIDKVYGVEIVDEAIQDAYHNAKINGLMDKSYFTAGKAEKVVMDDDIIKDNLKNIRLIIVDPPRDGLHKDLVEFLINLKKLYNFKLLYISCNPVSMSRDIGLLLEGGYTLKALQPLDMFPHTNHIETIGILH